jgi:hypothetical protein
MKYSCTKCKLYTDSENIWNRHIKSVKHKTNMGIKETVLPKKAPKKGGKSPENRPLTKPLNCPYCRQLFTMSLPLKEHITETCPKKPNFDSPSEKSDDDKSILSDSSSDSNSVYKNDFLSKQRSTGADSPLNMDSNPFGSDFGGYNSDDDNPILNPEKFAEIEKRLDELIRHIKMNNPREREMERKPVYPIEDVMDPYGVYYIRNPRLVKL